MSIQKKFFSRPSKSRMFRSAFLKMVGRISASFALLASAKESALADEWGLLPEWLVRATNDPDGITPDTFVRFGLELIQTLVEVAGVVAVIMVMFGGFAYVFGSFAEEKETGKNTLKYSLVGFVVCLLSWAIVDLVITFMVQD